MNYKNLLILLLLLAAGFGGYFIVNAVLTPKPLPAIQNPGFEDGLIGWKSNGYVGDNGYESESRLIHGAGTHETTQLLTDVPNGWITLRAWVNTSAKQSEAYIALVNCGKKDAYTTVPGVKIRTWTQIVVSTKVRGGECTIQLSSMAGEKEWVSFDALSLERGKQP